MRRQLGDIEKRILVLIQKKPCGLTIEEIAREMGINRTTASKYLFSLQVRDAILVRELGKAKLHYPNTRRVKTWLL